MGGGKDDAPEPPDLTPMAEASVESAEIWAKVQGEQLDWAKEQSAFLQDILEQTLGVQLPQMQAAFDNAQADRARYEEVFQPIEDKLIKEFEEFDSPERREQEAARRMADVRTSYEAQRRNAQQRLEDYGIDPSQTRSQALDLGMRGQEAANSALAANQGRKVIEQTGRALRGEAINIGRGMPAQVAMSQGIVNQTAGGAINNANSSTAAQGGTLSGALGAGGMSLSGWQQGANIYNSGYQNEMAQWDANQEGARGMGQLVGTLGGAAMGMMQFEEGGEVPYQAGGEVPQGGIPVPGSTDNVEATLTEGEFIIPTDVVRRKGTEFFDKLLEKYKDGGDYAMGQQAIG